MFLTPLEQGRTQTHKVGQKRDKAGQKRDTTGKKFARKITPQTEKYLKPLNK